MWDFECLRCCSCMCSCALSLLENQTLKSSCKQRNSLLGFKGVYHWSKFASLLEVMLKTMMQLYSSFTIISRAEVSLFK